MSDHDHTLTKPAEIVASHDGTKPPVHRSLIVHYLERSERIVLSLIAIVLVVLAVLLLVSNGLRIVTAVFVTKSLEGDSAIAILDGVLLVMMTMEIVYTVTLSLQSHKLVAEPFLIIGIIAAIRRTLVITAESSKLLDNGGDAADAAANAIKFQATLLELGLLAFIVGVMAASIYIMRRSQKYQSDPSETTLQDD